MALRVGSSPCTKLVTSQGKHPLCLTGTRIRVGGLDKAFDLGLRQERERLEQAGHLSIGTIEPELVELVDGKHVGVKPYRIAFRFSELLAIGVGDDRAGHHVDIDAANLVNEIEAGGQVAPLVGTAEFEHAVVMVVQVQIVVALQPGS